MRDGFFLTKEEQIVKNYLLKALDGSSSSVISLKLIRRFANETPELFCNAALAILNSTYDTPSQRYMAILLLKQTNSLLYLSSPRRFSKNESVGLFRYLMTVDRSLDIRLARCLPNRNGISAVSLPSSSSERALDILDETSTGRRIIPVLGHLMDHPDPRISSKATLLIGKRVQNVNWAKRLLAPGQDPRIRANAIEAIWGLDTEDAHSIMQDHVHDPNNRVAGNAAFGLHVLGEESAIAAVLELSNRPRPEFRQTSAWVMSRIGSADFVPNLNGLVKDDHPGVRSAALRALVHIRKETVHDQLVQVVEATTPTEQQEEKIELLKETSPVIVSGFNLRLDGKRYATVNS